VAVYDRAVHRLLRFHPDVIGDMRVFMAELPDLAMGQVLSGYLALGSTDVGDLAHARRALERLEGLELNEREAAHRSALAAWVGGDWHGAARRLDELLVQWPTDLLALQMGHQLDFYLGDAANLRDRVGRARAAVPEDHPHRGFVEGMYAFGLEESGHYQQARDHGLAALEANSDDVWAVHAVVHTHEMEGSADEGLRFLAQRHDDWSEGNLFVVHNHWHQALFLLETGRTADVLDIYDAHIYNSSSAGLPLEMLDASALLWRLLLDGADTGDRFFSLADAWSRWTGGDPWYVFNDLHAVLAFAGAARLPDAHALISRLDSYVREGAGSNVAMTAEVGLPACRAVVAFAEERYDDVLDELLPVRAHLARFGGSHAQRDVLQRTIVVAAQRAGRLDLAAALLSERLSVRETSVWSLRRWAEVLHDRGATPDADRASTEAAAHEARFAAA
jgi:tetratricopeptide (TPR) repeat protein